MGKSDRYSVIHIEVNEKKSLKNGGVLGDGERQAGLWDQTPERTRQYFEISSISQVTLLILSSLKESPLQ